MPSKRPYDVLVFIGRFSPLHMGHESVINKALDLADKVVVLVGSAYAPRDIRNPWTFDDRLEMFRSTFPHGGPIPSRIVPKPLPDYPYNDTKWAASVRATVMAGQPWTDMPPKIGLIGHNKDHTSYYLKMFPDWETVDVENYNGFNATDVRADYFDWLQPEPHGYGKPIPVWQDMLSPGVAKWIRENPLPKSLMLEYDIINRYKLAWENAPFPPTFHTVDAVVVQSSHVLLVKRRSAPGMGLWALPGGFLEQHETLLDGAVRELREETKLKIPERTLLRLAKGNMAVFDAPYRSTRGRTITTAFFVDLGDDKELPKVVGSDDAEKAKWVPLNEVKREMMFEDHFHIIDHFTNTG